MRHRKLLLTALSTAAVLYGVDPTGTLVGTVTDPSSSVVPNAAVSVRNQDTNAVRKLETSATGDYSVPLLPPGTYEISVESPNFRTSVDRNVEVDVSSTVRVDVQLQLGDFQQSIDVTAAAPLIQGDTSTLGHVVGGETIQELPLNARNFLSFTFMVPGAQLSADGSQSSSNGVSVSVNGAREQSNNFLLNGVDNNDLAINTYSVLPSTDAVDQFQVQSSTSSAEFGRSGGAQINAVLKTGSNAFHGTAFEYFRNRHLDAKNVFDQPDCMAASAAGSCAAIPRLDRNQFGATIGGPIRKDKTFFFVSYEGLRLRQGITRTAVIPSQADRAAALAAVPVGQQNSAGLQILNLYPTANVGTSLATSNSYVAAPTLRNTINQGLINLNHVFSSTDILSGHYAVYNEDRLNPYDPFFAFTNLPGYGSYYEARGQNAAINWTHSFSSRIINEVRVGFNRLSAGLIQQSQGAVNNQKFGFPQVVADPAAQGYPEVVVAGYDAIGEPINTPQQRHDTTFHYADTLAWSPAGGRHQVRAGVDVRPVRVNLSLYIFPRGEFQFLGLTGSPLQDLVLGIPAFAIGVQGNPRTSIRTLAQNYFVQDDIRLHPRVTLNIGLRYEFNSPPVDTQNALSVPNFRASATCSPQPNCLFLVAGTNGVPRSTFTADRNNFAPRLGLAWRPLASNRLVIRSAYGIFYDQAILNMIVSSHFNPPFYTGFIYPNLGTSTIQNIIGPVSFAAVTPNMMASNFRDGYVQQWNFTVQRELPQGLVLEAAYVGSKGTHLPDRRNINQSPPGGTSPFPQFGPIAYSESAASSIYHSLQMRAEKRFSRGFSFLASYTFSKSIDDASSAFQTSTEPAFPQDSFNLRAERGLSSFDARHRFVLSHLYELPIGPGKRWLSGPGIAGKILGSWTIGGIWTMQSGRPFTVNRAVNQSNTGTFTLAPTDRPDQIADPSVAGPVPNNPDPTCHALASQGGRAPDVIDAVSDWFNPCAFAAAPGRFGSAGRNSLIGPTFKNVDISLAKNTSLREGRELQARFEVFNVFNHPNFDVPKRVFDSPRFGQLTSANAYGNRPPRQIQIALKLVF
jgi:Carboxypeptidase regulatory-like domain/TonB dependent receptor-like, beta-barrel